MPGFIKTFEIPGPVRFKEKGCNLVFQLSVKAALYINDYDESAFGETKYEQIEAMIKLATDKIIDDLAHWHESDKLLRFDGIDVLGDSLTAFLREKGINGSARIDDLILTDASKALYQEQIIDPYNEKKSEEFNQKLEAAVEPHGPLRSVCYSLFSHGMMAGTSSSSSYTLDWNEDGSIIYRTTTMFSGKYIETKYKIKPETAQKMSGFVEEHKIAALSKLEVETPVMFDNFTSSTISVTYDDTSVGGEYRNGYTLSCGPAKMTFKSLEKDMEALFKEIEESGERIKNETQENQTPFPGFMGMNQMMNMIDMQGQPGHLERGVEMMGLVPCDPDAGKVNQDTMEKWTCKCGVENTGKFCCECGEPKPLKPDLWICSCGHENTGKFCMNCGNPKSVASEDGTWVCSQCNTSGNRGNFCAGCGYPKPK
ncbi:MAG: hypothetical protein IKO15_03075 [Clostridiales bacterium]|nr:hypothetical protein [Clostridiales bacterium]